MTKPREPSQADWQRALGEWLEMRDWERERLAELTLGETQKWYDPEQVKQKCLRALTEARDERETP